MAKKNEKHKYSSKAKHQKVKKTKRPKAPKRKRVQVDLKAVLHGIYNNVIDLRTTCNGSKTCCETAMPNATKQGSS